MQEASQDIIELQDIEGAVLQTLIAAMYGEKDTIPSDALPSLFLAADRHQVSCIFASTEKPFCILDMPVGPPRKTV